MAKSKKEKKELVKIYEDLIAKSKSVLVVRAQQVTPNEVNEFRKSVYDAGATFRVVKNNLFKIALKNQEYDVVESLDFGEHAVLFMSEDIVSPSKTLKKFSEEAKNDVIKQKITVVGGYLDGEKLSVEQAVSLADMPSKEESISMILGVIEQAVVGVLNVLEDAPRAYATILEQAFKEE